MVLEVVDRAADLELAKADGEVYYLEAEEDDWVMVVAKVKVANLGALGVLVLMKR